MRVSADLLGQIVFINADNKSKDGPPAVGLYEVVGFSNHACGVNARTGEHTLLLRQPDHGGEPVYLTGYGMYGKFKGYWEHVEPCDISPRLPCCFCGAPRLPLPGWTPSPFTAAFAAMTGSEKWAFMEACNAVGFSPCDVCTEEESLIELHTRNVLWRDRRAGLCTADGSWAGGGADGAAGGTAEGAAGGGAAGGGAAGVVAGGGAADGAAGGAACGAAGGGAAGGGADGAAGGAADGAAVAAALVAPHRRSPTGSADDDWQRSSGSDGADWDPGGDDDVASGGAGRGAEEAAHYWKGSHVTGQVYVAKSNIAGGGLFAAKKMAAGTVIGKGYGGKVVTEEDMEAEGFVRGYVQRVGGPFVDAGPTSCPDDRLVLANGSKIDVHNYEAADWARLDGCGDARGISWEGKASIVRFVNDSRGGRDGVANITRVKGGTWKLTRGVEAGDELLVWTYGKGYDNYGGGDEKGRGLATTLLERPEGGGIEHLLDALRGVPSPPLAGMCGGGVPHRSRGGGAEVSEITGVCSNATSFPSSILPPERPHCGGSEHLLAALRGVPAMCQRGLCAAGVPEKTSSSLPDTRAAPSDARRRDLPDSFLGSQDCGAPPALPEGVEDDDAISELLAALLTCPPPNAALAPTSYAAVAASALERETDGDHCNLQPTDVDLDAQEEQEEGVPTIMVDPLSWANAERVQWISADESVELGDQVCPPAEDASLPEKSRFKRLWTQTGYPLGWASMSQGTATILATVHDQWPL